MKNSSPSIIAFYQKVFIAVIFFTISIMSFAQPQERVWALPGNEVKFTPTPVATPLTIATYAGEPPLNASNSMSDFNGNLLFYVLDEDTGPSGTFVKIYDKDGYLIDDLKYSHIPAGQPTAGLAAEIGLIPVPNSCAKYYIVVGVGKLGLSKRPFHPEYAILDMSKPNIYDATKRGALEYFSPGVNTINLQTTDATLSNAWYVSGTNVEDNIFGIAITPLRLATNDYFLYINGKLNIFRFVVNGTGIFLDTNPLAGDGGIVDGSFPISLGNNTKATETEIIDLGTGSYRFARIQGDYKVRVFDFDYILGTYIPLTFRDLSVRTTTSIGTFDAVGLEFSPSGNNLYFTYLKIEDFTGHTGYFDLTLATPIPQTFAFLGTDSLGLSFIEMGFDGKLYYNSGSNLMTLSPPFNLPPSGSNWNNNAATLDLTTQALPDQMDGQDYKGNPIFIDYTAGTAGALTFTSYTSLTQTWTPTSNPFGGTALNPVGTATNPITILGELVIPAGYNITIQGMTFKFKARTINYPYGSPPKSWGARVLIQNVTSTSGPQVGGRLSLTSLSSTPTIFTSDDICSNGMWEGIEVWGNQALIQGEYSGITAGKQGWLRMFNGSVISNAYIGALAGKKYYDANTTSYVYNSPISYGGGIIQTYSSSVFLNNQFGVYFSNYNVGNNVSTFNKTKFITNATFVSADNVKPNAMALLNDVKGIYFKACTFANDATLYPQVTTSALFGIRGYNAQFFCIPEFYLSTVGCTFDNFNYGIFSTYYGNTKTVTVDYATFTNNYRGTYLSGPVLVPTIVRSKYNIMNYVASSAINRAYGLYMNGCTGYKIEGNDFTTVGSSTTANDIGIIVNNSGPYANRIYRNTFHEVWAGIQAQNRNCAISTIIGDPNPINYLGLQNTCNTFNNIKEMDLGITSGCIDYHQGLNLVPAGNKFSHSANTSYNDYFTYSATNDLAFIGYIHNTDYFQSPQPTFFTPPPSIIAANNGLSYNSSSQCLSSLTGFHLTPLVSNLKNQIQNYQTLIAALQALLDAGKDISLINAIISSMPAGDLKNLLISKSPYLSDEVLIAAILRYNPLPSGQIKQIIVANSPVTQPVKEALNSISLPNGIRNQINAAQVGTSQRRIAEDKILYYQFQINMNKNDILRDYVNDTTVDIKVDTIIKKIIDFEGIDPIGVDRKEALADLYTEKQDYISAETMIAQIEAIPGKQNLAKIKRVNKSLKQSGQTTDALITDAVNKNKVDEVAADDSNQGFEPATNILQQVFAQSYEEPIDEYTPAMHSYTPMLEQDYEPIQLISLYPNPNNGYMQLDYILNEGEVGELRILDVTGRVVAQYNLNANEYVLQVDQTILNSGLYLYQVLTNGKVVDSDKLIIIK